MRLRACVVGCALLGAAAGGTSCADPTGVGRAELAQNREKWAASGPDAYVYRYQRAACECLPEWVQPVLISVAGGEVTLVTLVANGDTVPPPAFRFTVDSLFGIIQEAFERDADHMTATYDPQYGYPSAVYIDYDETTADEELGFWAELVDPS